MFYLCPISWATVKAVERPVSSLTIQLLNSLHIPSIGAKPVKRTTQATFQSQMVLLTNLQKLCHCFLNSKMVYFHRALIFVKSYKTVCLTLQKFYLKKKITSNFKSVVTTESYFIMI